MRETDIASPSSPPTPSSDYITIISQSHLKDTKESSISKDSHNSNRPINPSPKHPPKRRPKKRRRKAIPNTRHRRPRQSNDQHVLPPAPPRVRRFPPEKRRGDLRAREAALEDPRLAGDLGVAEGRAHVAELVEDVGLEGGELEEVDEAAEEEDEELVFVGEGGPCYWA